MFGTGLVVRTQEPSSFVPRRDRRADCLGWMGQEAAVTIDN